MANAPISSVEARAIAREACIYGYPMADGYRIQHAYVVDRTSPEFKAPWNQICNIPRVFTPDDKAQTSNSDTPYSMVGLDLRSEPIVLTVPKIEEERYFSIQLIDAYDSPGKDREASWLPAPPGPFLVAMRLYWPKDEVLTGKWKASPLQRMQ